MKQNDESASAVKFPRVLSYRSQRSIYVPMDQNDDGTYTHSIRIYMDDILSIRSHPDGYCNISTNNREPIRTLCQLCDFLNILDKASFARIAHDTIVNLTKVDVVYPKALSINGVFYDVCGPYIEEVMESFSMVEDCIQTGNNAPWPYEKELFVHDEKCAKRVRLPEVTYIDVGGNFTTIHFSGRQKSISIMIPLKVWHQILPQEHFVKISKSVIINQHYVDGFVTQEPYSIDLGKNTFKVSRPYYHQIKTTLPILHPTNVVESYKAEWNRRTM